MDIDSVAKAMGIILQGLELDRVRKRIKVKQDKGKTVTNKEVENIIKKLFDYYLKNFDKLPKDWSIQKKEESENRIICDYISGMTDRYASKLYKSIYE